MIFILRSILWKKSNIFFLFLYYSYGFLFINIVSYCNTVSTNLSDSFFRLHIIANSNSDVDQKLKLKIRDKINEHLNMTIPNMISKEETIIYCKNNLSLLTEIANQVIKNEGFNYKAKLDIGNYYFPTKHYQNISLPAGYYDALKINIGNAEGENWWCSLFPPLCFIDMSNGVLEEESKENLEDDLSTEELDLITKNSDQIKFKFKLLELFSHY